jgi:hypothetical protein
MKKIKELRLIIPQNDTLKTRELVSWISFAEQYSSWLDRAFFVRPISKTSLMFFLPMLRREMRKGGLRGDPEFKLWLKKILFIVRHTWELIDEQKKVKTGDDLHKANPRVFPGEKMLKTEDIYQELI